MTASRFSLYQLLATSRGYYDQDGSLFDSTTYSNFKYGCHASAQIYASQIAERLLKDYGHWRHEEVLLTGSAHRVAPTAAEAIAQMVFELIRDYFPFIRKVKVDRESLSPNDYGALSTQERFDLMEKNILTIERELFVGKKLIVVDDLKVTGAHEKKIMDLVSGLVDEVLFAYVGEFCGTFSPTVESQMNHLAINSIDDVRKISEKGIFHVNARVCKYILSYKNPEELRLFFLHMPVSVLERLDECIRGDGYHLMVECRENYSILCEALREEPALFSRAV